jgi:ribonuclease I
MHYLSMASEPTFKPFRVLTCGRCRVHRSGLYTRANFNMALMKNLRLTEMKSLQFRIEEFNVLNHAQFFGPEYCSPARPVSQNIIESTLKYIPTESLIQHEWAAHGTCSGLTARDYFAALRKVRDSLSIPTEINEASEKQQVSPDKLKLKLASANPRFPKSAFRTYCYRDGELEEVRVCMNKDLSPRACGPSAGECRFRTVTLLPVR